MKKAEAVFRSVLEKITPGDSKVKETQDVLMEIEKTTVDVIKPFGLKHTLAGSFLRDTWLADKLEFDIFILFPESVPRDRLEKQGLELGSKITRSLKGCYEIAYAEHPYIKAKIGEYTVDFVPCYDVKDPGNIKSAVDRTPHHNRYLLKNLTPELSPQVRLLKKFCKGIGVYGSDLKVEGFSGYLTELLIIHYRTLKNLMLEAAEWEAGKVFIDLNGHHKKPVDAKKIYPGQPLIVIDPVDKGRNVAAALSPGNFEKFRYACASFLKSPDEKFFTRGKGQVNLQSLRKSIGGRGTKLLCVWFTRPGVVDDVLFPQLRKSARRLRGMITEAEFAVMGHDVWCDIGGCAILVEMEVWCLPNVRKLTGPPLFSKTHSGQFIKKYRGRARMWVEGMNWVAEVRREYTDVDRLIRKSLKKGRKSLEADGIASYVAAGLASGFTLMSEKEIYSKAKKNRDFAGFLAEYFKKNIV